MWQSTLKEVLTDSEESDDEDDADESSRLPSPEPIFPLPTDSDPDSDFDFCKLSIHQQFSYVKPVLKAILNDTYKPSRSRHLDYVKGGTARARTQESAASRGTVSVADVETLQKCMTRWVLREKRRAGKNLYKDLEEGGEMEVVTKGNDGVGIIGVFLTRLVGGLTHGLFLLGCHYG